MILCMLVNVVNFIYFQQRGKVITWEIKTRDNKLYISFMLHWILLFLIIWLFFSWGNYCYFLFCEHSVAGVPKCLDLGKEALYLERPREWERKFGSLELSGYSVWSQSLLPVETEHLDPAWHCVWHKGWRWPLGLAGGLGSTGHLRERIFAHNLGAEIILWALRSHWMFAGVGAPWE